MKQFTGHSGVRRNGDGLFFPPHWQGRGVEFFATVVVFLHLGHVQAQSASVASALMTFVPDPSPAVPVAWPNVLKLASSFCFGHCRSGSSCCYCGLLLLAIAGRLVRAFATARSVCQDNQDNRLICTGFLHTPPPSASSPAGFWRGGDGAGKGIVN